MKVALLNIGNTHSEVCAYDLSQRKKIKTNELLSIPDLFSDYSDIYTASVVADSYPRLVQQHKNIHFHQLTVDKVKSIDFSQVEALSLGADRLANVLAAKSLYGGRVLVVDCGTCVTAELLFDEDFLGGLIMPGRALQRRALNLYTSQLPDVEFSDSLFDLGHNTQEAISIGTDNISLLGLHKWIESIMKSYSGLRVCFTGGDYKFYTNKASFEYSERPHLTLEGLRVFADGKS